MPLELGTISRKLGAGGFAQVFLATVVSEEGSSGGEAQQRALESDKSAALKVVCLSFNHAHWRFAMKSLMHEWQVLSSLTHKNVVRSLGITVMPSTVEHGMIKDTASNNIGLLLEYCSGGTLWSQVWRAQNGSRPYTMREAVGWAIDIASALTYLHSQPVPVIHRDLKLENVLLQYDPELKRRVARLCDFGLSAYIKGGTAHVASKLDFTPPEADLSSTRTVVQCLMACDATMHRDPIPALPSASPFEAGSASDEADLEPEAQSQGSMGSGGTTNAVPVPLQLRDAARTPPHGRPSTSGHLTTVASVSMHPSACHARTASHADASRGAFHHADSSPAYQEPTDVIDLQTKISYTVDRVMEAIGQDEQIGLGVSLDAGRVSPASMQVQSAATSLDRRPTTSLDATVASSTAAQGAFAANSELQNSEKPQQPQRLRRLPPRAFSDPRGYSQKTAETRGFARMPSESTLFNALVAAFGGDRRQTVPCRVASVPVTPGRRSARIDSTQGAESAARPHVQHVVSSPAALAIEARRDSSSSTLPAPEALRASQTTNDNKLDGPVSVGPVLGDAESSGSANSVDASHRDSYATDAQASGSNALVHLALSIPENKAVTGLEDAKPGTSLERWTDLSMPDDCMHKLTETEAACVADIWKGIAAGRPPSASDKLAPESQPQPLEAVYSNRATCSSSQVQVNASGLATKEQRAGSSSGSSFLERTRLSGAPTGPPRRMLRPSANRSKWALTGETGSIAYMAPEVISCHPYNAKIDIFSFSILLWEIFARQSVVAAMTSPLEVRAWAKEVQKGTARKAFPKHFPPTLCRIISEGWAQEPAQRLTASAMLAALQEFGDSTEAKAFFARDSKKRYRFCGCLQA